jgi:hypothetical protein
LAARKVCPAAQSLLADLVYDAQDAGSAGYSFNAGRSLGRCCIRGADILVCRHAWQARMPAPLRKRTMMRRMLLAVAALLLLAGLASMANAQDRAYGRVWGGQYGRLDWERFYHYPYVWYPQNFWGGEYYRSSEDLYFRYPPEMRVPVYNRQWHNYYPEGRRYHHGHHFILDVF